MREKITKTRLIISAALLGGGLYLLMHLVTLVSLPQPVARLHSYEQGNAKLGPSAANVAQENRLYIPKISVDVGIVEGDISALKKGAWHRKPENGNPVSGGNFVLSGHRFKIGWTPQQTRKRSSFYHIDKLQPGDIIIVDYEQKRYQYAVTKKYHVGRNAIEIEAPSEEAKITLYSCDLRGESNGREVIEAIPAQT